LLAAITETRMLLFECGVDMSLMPMLAWRPCHTPAAAGDPRVDGGGAAAASRLSSRSLLGEGVRGRRGGAAGCRMPALITLRSPMHPLQRLRLVDRAGRHRPPPRAGRCRRAILPHLSLGACDANGVCAAVCPTGALQKARARGRTSAELRFESLRCIACNQCARVCPERSLRLDVQGGEAAGRWSSPPGGNASARAAAADFSDPAASAEPASAASLCSTCRKTEALSRGVAAFLRPTLGSDVSQP
jgi:Fe-S-cluster-containing hydrogenase component 2